MNSCIIPKDTLVASKRLLKNQVLLQNALIYYAILGRFSHVALEFCLHLIGFVGNPDEAHIERNM